MEFDHLQFLSVFSWSLYKRRGVDLTTLLYSTESYVQFVSVLCTGRKEQSIPVRQS